MTMERRTAYCDPVRMSRDDSGDGTPLEEPGDRQANVVTSLLPDGMHAPVLDIDFPCFVVPSSTPGHFHLYLDHELDWDRYKTLLMALVDAGIIGYNYAHHSLNRGQTVARMPWVDKHGPAIEVAPPGEGEEPF